MKGHEKDFFKVDPSISALDQCGITGRIWRKSPPNITTVSPENLIIIVICTLSQSCPSFIDTYKKIISIAHILGSIRWL